MNLTVTLLDSFCLAYSVFFNLSNIIKGIPVFNYINWEISFTSDISFFFKSSNALEV